MRELSRWRGPACRPSAARRESCVLLFLWLLPKVSAHLSLFILKRPGTERKRKPPRLCSGLLLPECVCSRSSSKNKIGQSRGEAWPAAGAWKTEPASSSSRLWNVRLEGNFQSGHIVSKKGNWRPERSNNIWAVAEPGLLRTCPPGLDFSSSGVDSAALDNLLSLLTSVISSIKWEWD